MSKLYRTITFLLIIVCVVSCTKMPDVKIDRYPAPVDYSQEHVYISHIPVYDPSSLVSIPVDLRSSNLTELDLTKSKEDLRYATFDSKTKWPAVDKMPLGFDPQRIMELGKDPGLGIRMLHQQGVTGKGVGIAIIDQTLLIDHIEYKDRIRLYEEADVIVGPAQLHGPAVASIAVGKTVGVAPDADLYFIATLLCAHGVDGIFDFACLAKSVRRIIDVNKTLPSNRKIRVLSMSIGWDSNSRGYDEITAAVADAKKAGIFVISSSLHETYGWNFNGMGRDSLSDPNDFKVYMPGLWWHDYFYKNGLTDTLLVPMDARTTASPTGVDDYVFYYQGGWSWSIPYLAGIYALTAQVKPAITPQEFWSTALQTGRTITLQHDNKEYEFGKILDPQALINAIK